jgi:hypothetical protein
MMVVVVGVPTWRKKKIGPRPESNWDYFEFLTNHWSFRLVRTRTKCDSIILRRLPDSRYLLYKHFVE